MKKLLASSLVGGLIGSLIMAVMLAWAAQTYVLPTGTTEHQTEHLTNIPNRDEALRSTFSAPTAPTSPTSVEGQQWYQTDIDIPHVYNGTSWLDYVLTGATQTLTNKTLTSPTIGAIVNTGTLTLPTATDTLVGRATTDTLINKTISSPIFSGTATGTYTLGGTPTFSVMPTNTSACASGYTRTAFNFCQINSASTTYTWTDQATCTARTVQAAVPTTARAVLMRIFWRGLANNVAGAARANSVGFYTSTDCNALTIAVRSDVNFIEWNASTAGATIGESSDQLIVPLLSSNTFYTAQTNSGGNGNADVIIYNTEGYFD